MCYFLASLNCNFLLTNSIWLKYQFNRLKIKSKREKLQNQYPTIKLWLRKDLRDYQRFFWSPFVVMSRVYLSLLKSSREILVFPSPEPRRSWSTFKTSVFFIGNQEEKADTMWSRFVFKQEVHMSTFCKLD